jgi:hypothetical protein
VGLEIVVLLIDLPNPLFELSIKPNIGLGLLIILAFISFSAPVFSLFPEVSSMFSKLALKLLSLIDSLKKRFFPNYDCSFL